MLPNPDRSGVRLISSKARGHQLPLSGPLLNLTPHPMAWTLLPDSHGSDQIGNKGAFIHLKEDCVPVFTQFEAVVSAFPVPLS